MVYPNGNFRVKDENTEYDVIQYFDRKEVKIGDTVIFKNESKFKEYKFFDIKWQKKLVIASLGFDIKEAA